MEYQRGSLSRGLRAGLIPAIVHNSLSSASSGMKWFIVLSGNAHLCIQAFHPLSAALSSFIPVRTPYLHQPTSLCLTSDWNSLAAPDHYFSDWAYRLEIICHTLSQSHSGVLKEQRVSYEDNSRPGDVYHPDFQHGRPAYFDVSVRSTTQPSHISFSSCGGVAAAAGELAKDQRHQDAVEEGRV